MKNKKFMKFSVGLLTLSLILSQLMPAMQSYAEETELPTIEQYRSGSAWTTELDEEDYIKIEIYGEKDLLELAEVCTLDSYSREKWVELKCDISLTCLDLQIPSFAGVFDGNGHTISNYRLSGKLNDSGFFRYVQSSARIMDLTIEGKVKSTGAGNGIGGIAGHNYGVIENCVFRGSVTGENDLGGIAAVNEDGGKIISCVNEATLLGMHRTGGIAGSNYGLIKDCVNKGKINTHSPEISIDYTNLTVEDIENVNSTENVEASIDSGGIAGLSEGAVYDSRNMASIGYPHVGYNTGGIVGRMGAGYVTGCVNEGEIKGRKDVGGIVGQMEPFMQLEYMTEKFDALDAEMDEMLTLLDEFREEASAAGEEMSSLIFDIAANLRTASASMTNLSNSAMYLWEVYNYGLGGIGTEFQELGDMLEDSADDEETNGGADVSGGDSIWDDIVSGGDTLPGVNPDGNPELNPDGTLGNYEDLSRYAEELSDFANNTGDYLKYMTSASQSQTEPIRSNLNTLNQSMTAASASMSELSIMMEDETNIMSGQMDAIMDQTEVLYDLIAEIRDDLFGYETVNIYDESDTVAEVTDILQGKLEKCENLATVDADTCVGGIVGQISVEYDYDPEEDLEVSGEQSAYANATVRAVISECLSKGDVVVKRDYAGGIVGKASYGAVLWCQAYADIDGSNGSYIGGIAGEIAGTVRSGYTMCNVSGKNYVGGIAGRGNDILYSCAFVGLEENAENIGNIAGQIMEEGILHCNFYVVNKAGGVNGIAYQGGAMPLTYGELKGIENLPEQFKGLILTFVVDDEIVAEYSCEYGENISKDKWPDIPEKEGYYAYWPEDELEDVRGNKVVEAQYVRLNGGLASASTDENGLAKLLVEGTFKEDWELVYDEGAGSFMIVDSKTGEECYTDSVKVRYLVSDTDAKWIVKVASSEGEKQVDYSTMGSYLIFEMDAPGSFSVSEAEREPLPIEVVYGVIIVLLVAVIVLVTLVIWKKQNGRKKAKNDVREKAESEEDQVEQKDSEK